MAEQPASGRDLVFDLRAGDGHQLEVIDSSGRSVVEAHVPVALSHLVSAVTGTAIADFSGFAAHAGVVSVGGQGIAIAAVSGTGKSTLTAACVREGFDYVTDEALCIRSGRDEVVPLPKPLALGPTSISLLGIDLPHLPAKTAVAASDLGGTIAQGPVRLTDVVELVRTGAGSSVPTPVGRDRGIATLLRMSFNAYRDIEGAVATVSDVVSRARCWTLDVADLRTAAGQLLELTSRRHVGPSSHGR